MATTGVPALSTTAPVTSPPGSSPIKISQYTFTAPNYSPTFVNGTFTITNQLAQSITFTQPLPTVTYGAPLINLPATAGSGLPVVYTATGRPVQSAGRGSKVKGIDQAKVNFSAGMKRGKVRERFK